jgi:hypothetical protein
MPQTIIVECNKCTGLLLAGAEQKTRTCPYCGTNINLQKAKHLAKASTATEASEILRKLKSERQANPHA